MSTRDGIETMKSSSFASKSVQRGKQTSPQQANPGPGAYEPLDQKAGASVGAVSMRNKGQRFIPERVTTESIVGPGRYDSHMVGTIGHKTSELSGHALSASFGSDVIRPKLEDLW